MKKHAENMLIPDPFLILVNNPKQPKTIQRILLWIGYFERGLSKRFKKF